MRKELLNYYGEINAAYLHAHSEAGTEFLLRELNPKNNETILELGCGTGGTLIKIKARTPFVKLYGLDLSETMLKKSSARLKFCGIGRDVHIKAANGDNTLPFEDNTFEKIYIESVLGIQDGTSLKKILSELLRVLKPGGRMILNETVWLPETSSQEIEEINTACKAAFGIIQANAEYPKVTDWLNLFHAIGFSHAEVKQIRTEKANGPKNFPELLSRVYTMIGKIKSYQPSKIRELRQYEKNMNHAWSSKKYMEGMLFLTLK